jgi:hypothetical protein
VIVFGKAGAPSGRERHSPRPVPQSQVVEASRRSAALFRQSVLEAVSISVNSAGLRIEICNEIQSLGLKKTQTRVRFNG